MPLRTDEHGQVVTVKFPHKDHRALTKIAARQGISFHQLILKICSKHLKRVTR